MDRSGIKNNKRATKNIICVTNNNISPSNIILAPLIFLTFDPSSTP